MKKTRLTTFFILLALIVASFSLAAAADPPTPTPGSATVDGDYSEWDLSEDLFAPMYEAGNPDKTHLANLYLRYDCETETLFTLTLAVGNFVADQIEDNVWVAINGNLGNKLTRIAYAWTTDGNGVEASYEMPPVGFLPPYTFTVHMNIFEDRTAQTVLWLDLNVACFDYGDLPNLFSLTLEASDGARHEKGDLYLGAGITIEVDGKPDPFALGDEGPSYDGVVPQGNWSIPSNGTLKVNVTNGPGCLFGWLDYKGGSEGFDGSFTTDEVLLYNQPVVDGENIIPINTFVNPIDSGAIQGALTYARFRLLPMVDGVCNYGVDPNKLDMLKGFYVDGEVEDYYWPFGTNAVSMAGFSASTQSVPTIWIAVAALLSLIGVTVFAWMRRRTA